MAEGRSSQSRYSNSGSDYETDSNFDDVGSSGYRSVGSGRESSVSGKSKFQAPVLPMITKATRSASEQAGDENWDEELLPTPAVNLDALLLNTNVQFISDYRLAGWKPSKKKKVRENIARGRWAFEGVEEMPKVSITRLKPVRLPEKIPNSALISDEESLSEMSGSSSLASSKWTSVSSLLSTDNFEESSATVASFDQRSITDNAKSYFDWNESCLDLKKKGMLSCVSDDGDDSGSECSEISSTTTRKPRSLASESSYLDSSFASSASERFVPLMQRDEHDGMGVRVNYWGREKEKETEQASGPTTMFDFYLNQIGNQMKYTTVDGFNRFSPVPMPTLRSQMK